MFSEHFTNKIELLLSKIDNTQHALSAETPLYIKTMDSFTHTNSINVLTLLKLTKKTCDLDPLPSTVLTECFDVLAPFITQIINMSISQGQVPSLLKEATPAEETLTRHKYTSTLSTSKQSYTIIKDPRKGDCSTTVEPYGSYV